MTTIYLLLLTEPVYRYTFDTGSSGVGVSTGEAGGDRWLEVDLGQSYAVHMISWQLATDSGDDTRRLSFYILAADGTQLLCDRSVIVFKPMTLTPYAVDYSSHALAKVTDVVIHSDCISF